MIPLITIKCRNVWIKTKGKRSSRTWYFRNDSVIQLLIHWFSYWFSDFPARTLLQPSHLKSVGRVVHTVHPEGEAQRVARIRTTEHGQPQTLDCLLVQWLPHQGVATGVLQQHVAPLGLQQTVTGCALFIHRRYFLWKEVEMYQETKSCECWSGIRSALEVWARGFNTAANVSDWLH